MSERNFEQRDEDEAGRRAAVEAADDTGLVRQAEAAVRIDTAGDGEPEGDADRE